MCQVESAGEPKRLASEYPNHQAKDLTEGLDESRPERTRSVRYPRRGVVQARVLEDHGSWNIQGEQTVGGKDRDSASGGCRGGEPSNVVGGWTVTSSATSRSAPRNLSVRGSSICR